MTNLKTAFACGTALMLAAVPALAQTAPATPTTSTPTVTATVTPPSASAPAAETPRTPAVDAYAGLPRGERSKILALYNAQRATPRAWSPERIAAARHHAGWGVVFARMRAEGLIHARNFGQLVSSEHHAMAVPHHHDHHPVMMRHFVTSHAGTGIHSALGVHHRPVVVSYGNGTTSGAHAVALTHAGSARTAGPGSMHRPVAMAATTTASTALGSAAGAAHSGTSGGERHHRGR